MWGRWMEDSGALPVGGCGGWVCLVVDGRPACVCVRAGGVWWVCLVRMASLCLVGGGMVGGRSVGVGGRPSVCGVCGRPSVWVWWMIAGGRVWDVVGS